MTAAEFEDLKRRAAADEPAALYEYSLALGGSDPARAEMYMIFAAQLGDGRALECMGDKYLAVGRFDDAKDAFRSGAKAGMLDCSVKLAAMHIATDETRALRELEELAEGGVRSACIALSEYYKSSGNRKEAAYWRSLLK